MSSTSNLTRSATRRAYDRSLSAGLFCSCAASQLARSASPRWRCPGRHGPTYAGPTRSVVPPVAYGSLGGMPSGYGTFDHAPPGQQCWPGGAWCSPAVFEGGALAVGVLGGCLPGLVRYPLRASVERYGPSLHVSPASAQLRAPIADLWSVKYYTFCDTSCPRSFC